MKHKHKRPGPSLKFGTLEERGKSWVQLQLLDRAARYSASYNKNGQCNKQHYADMRAKFASLLQVLYSLKKAIVDLRKYEAELRGVLYSNKLLAKLPALERLNERVLLQVVRCYAACLDYIVWKNCNDVLANDKLGGKGYEGKNH